MPPPSAPAEEAPLQDPCKQEVDVIRERLKRGGGITGNEAEQAQPCLEKVGVSLI